MVCLRRVAKAPRLTWGVETVARIVNQDIRIADRVAFKLGDGEIIDLAVERT